MVILFLIGLAIAAGTKSLVRVVVVLIGQNRWQHHLVPLPEGKQNG